MNDGDGQHAERAEAELRNLQYLLVGVQHVVLLHEAAASAVRLVLRLMLRRRVRPGVVPSPVHRIGRHI